MIHDKPLAVSRDNIKEDMFKALRGWTDGTKYVINHNDHPVELSPRHKGLDIPSEVAFSGTNSELKEWVEDFPHKYGAIYVVAGADVVYDMDKLRPGLCFYHISVRDGI